MIQVWFVVGDPDEILFVNKISAERHAREIFPDDPADRRYGRIKYKQVFNYE